MEAPTISLMEVEQQLQKMKEPKTQGLDGMKAELLKIIGSDAYCKMYWFQL